MSPTSVSDLIESLASEPDVSLGPLLERVTWTLLGISILVVSLRLYAKWQAARRLFLDDILMIIAVAFGLAHAIIIQLAINNKFGSHIIDIFVSYGLVTLEKTMKFGALSLMFGFTSPMFGRISFCYTLLYLTKTDSRLRTWPIYCFIILQVIVNITGVVVFYAQCGANNIDAFWNFQKQLRFNEICWDPRIQTDYQYGMGAFNTVTDAFLSILPAILVEHTKLSRKSKIGVAILLCLSVLAMAASIVKTYEAKVLSQVTDYTYNLCTYVIAMSVELNVVIITASIPLLRPLWKRSLGTTTRSLPIQLPLRHTHIPLSSALSSKNHSRTNTAQLTSISSFEQIMPLSPIPPAFPSPGIIVTIEVEVSFQEMDTPFVHAALVGLIQGELANPRLVRR